MDAVLCVFNLRDFRVIMFYPLGRVVATIPIIMLLVRGQKTILLLEGMRHLLMVYAINGDLPRACYFIVSKNRLWRLPRSWSAVCHIYALSALDTILNAAVIFYIWWTRSESRRSFNFTKIQS